MAKPNPSSLRVLIRPETPPAQTLPSQSSTLPFTDKIVVVGFIGQRPHDTTQLINRILDSNVFGSGKSDKKFSVGKDELVGEESVSDWFKFRRISYYWDRVKGIVFLQFASSAAATQCVRMGDSECCSGFDSTVEELEFGDLQGLLFMFSVCHVIIYVQEGSRFDVQVLKKLRVLQAAKHGLAPFVRSQTPSMTSNRHSSPSSRPFTSSSKNPSPGRNHVIMNRNSSAVSVMSGLGSFSSLFPGQCTPVTLFVFLDDFSDVPTQVSNGEDSTDSSIFNPSPNLSNTARSSLPIKGSGPVVVLARPASKSEGGFRNKLLASLEAQIRFLIKKCRILSGTDSSHSYVRNGRVSGSSPLFSLDSLKAVVLLDRSLNQLGESLDFASSIVEEILNGTVTSDALLLESHDDSENKEDMQSLKEFIYRQSDILRGRGGLVNNANSGSAAGVGRVAVAAAAAAASAASGKAFAAPELPSMDLWLSSSQALLHRILAAHNRCIDKTELNQTKSQQQNSLPPHADGTAPKVADHLEISLSCLESGNEFNTKFSTLWCQRALPAAREIYLKELPPCYPTSLHEVHLEKALRAFYSMVKGPAVQNFAKQLEEECTSTWKSGRQLCDAVSLTGKPCIHQRHDIDGGLSLGAELKPHSSGFVFLHACACGRSRRLRTDPFDFETANIISSYFPDCDELLPAVELPEVRSVGPIRASAWSLIRVGGSRYYDPSKGLLQSGFFASQKFLLHVTIFLEKQANQNDSSAGITQQGSVNRPSTDFEAGLSANVSTNKASADSYYQNDFQSGIRSKTSSAENMKSEDMKISFGNGSPNYTLRKRFSQVVAESAAIDSEFPPLQLKRQQIINSGKGFKQSGARDRGSEKLPATATNEYEESLKVENISSVRKTSNVNGPGDPFLRIGSNIVPVNMNPVGKIKLDTSPKQVIVYLGFEHECPHGHRFILTPDQLSEAGLSCISSQESQAPSYVENFDHKLANPSNLAKNASHGKANRYSNGSTTSSANKMRNMDKSKQNMANGNLYVDGQVRLSRSGKEQKRTSISVPMHPNSVTNLEENLQSVSLDDGGSAFSMINRDIPIYMNCPHCRNFKKKKDMPDTRFSSAISQLQRIFLVTPPFPVVLATFPVIQFESSCLSPAIPDREQKLQFGLECQVILPPESFLTLRLPFIYGVQLDDGSSHPLKPFEHQPELTAWISKGTALQVVSKGKSLVDG